MTEPFTKKDLAELLDEIGRYDMPFGKYGPGNFPPDGIPIYDLPEEYLLWFKTKGFPKGRLGELLEIVYQAKMDGADAMFDLCRARRGGRRSLRKPRQREFRMED